MWSLEQKKDILITGSHDKTVSWYTIIEYVVCNFILQAAIWNIRHCKLKQQLCGHAGAVFSVDLDEKAKIAYTGSGDKVILYTSLLDCYVHFLLFRQSDSGRFTVDGALGLLEPAKLIQFCPFTYSRLASILEA